MLYSIPRTLFLNRDAISRVTFVLVGQQRLCVRVRISGPNDGKVFLINLVNLHLSYIYSVSLLVFYSYSFATTDALLDIGILIWSAIFAQSRSVVELG